MAQKTPSRFYTKLFDLEGKVAVVIGGTGVLCGEMARGLLQVGCRVGLVGRNKKKADRHFQHWKSSSDNARFLKADATQRDKLNQIIPKVIEWFGRIDIWINGAAIAPPGPYLEITDEQFDTIVDVDLKTVHMGCQIIGKHWLDRKEKGQNNISAVQEVEETYQVPVTSIITLDHLIEYLQTQPDSEDILKRITDYQKNHGVL